MRNMFDKIIFCKYKTKILYSSFSEEYQRNFELSYENNNSY